MSDKTSGPYRICIEDSDEDVKRIEGLNRAYADGFRAGKRKANKDRIAELERVEAERIEVLRVLGCVCPAPLLGGTPTRGPRCRLCNTEIKTKVKEAVKIEAEKITEHYDRIIDNRVNKAVEEFRERAADVCRDSVREHDTWADCTKTPYELAAMIRALPIEEGKGEK